MSTYSRVAGSDCVVRGDGLGIPADPNNGDWQAYQAWLLAGNVPIPAPVPLVAPDLACAAKTALDASDTTVLRCIEAGVQVPSDWVTYRKMLRAVLAGSAATLPARPSYPSST